MDRTFRPTVYGRTLLPWWPLFLVCGGVAVALIRNGGTSGLDVYKLAALLVVMVPSVTYYLLTQFVCRVTVMPTTIRVRNLFGQSSDYARGVVAKLVRTHWWSGGKGGQLPYIAARDNDDHTVFRLTGSYDPDAIGAELNIPVTGSW